MGALALLLASAVCIAAPVRQDPNGSLTVKVGPLTGMVTAYDSVGGRFNLRVGSLRTRDGLSQKIPWFVDSGAKVGDTLVVNGTALSEPRPRTFRQVFRSARVGTRSMFPSVIAPPSAGCWMLTFTSGPMKARLAVVVRPRPVD